MKADGNRSPRAAPGGTALSISARSSAVRISSTAGSASASRSRVRAPTSGTMSSTSPRAQRNLCFACAGSGHATAKPSTA